MQNHLNLFSNLPTLRTARLTLRPARMSDAADLYEYSKDPEVARHVLWDAHTSIHQTRSYLRFLIRQYRAGQPATFVIVWNENRKAIGTIGFMWMQQENRSAEVGYSLSRAYWNRGIMTEALEAVLEALRNRPAHQTAIVTGRGCHRDILELADTVSELRPVKHAFDAGIKAQIGIDY